MSTTDLVICLAIAIPAGQLIAYGIICLWERFYDWYWWKVKR